ncbi:putative disease resistance protein RGA4 [Hevea brasiliensis]|uniref:putative disease resistance protein RGA4 n=1 Tax=Hevea brasiliensis TaxID=3981 RepID=UPI0026011D83|nr:putative disease resistance protein RGA4 [Hevea brasiliensis]
MAEAILFDIAGEIIMKLGSLALDEIGVCWGVNDELQKLKRTVSRIQAVLLDAEKKQALDEQVKDWLGKLQEVVYDADDLLDDFATEALQHQVMTGNRLTKEVSLFFSSSNRLVYGFKMGHKIKAIRERLADIEADKQFTLEVQTGVRGYTTMVRDQTESSVPRVVIGRDSDKKAIVELLVASNSEENVSVLSIVGIGGLGKTSLAQLIFNDERIKNYFELKIWVCVSDPFDVKMIVRKILESATGAKSEDLELEALKSQLGNIMYSKRYLLVLDDVWNENREKWDNLKKLLEGGSSGTKILVTTRSERVAQISSTVKPYVLKALSPSESWSLFLQVALKGQEPKDSNIKVIGEKIVNKCVGVPLAIKTIASLLCFKDPKNEWATFLDNELSKVEQNENDILPTLKLSYDNLSSHLKHCFTYCALFPKDHLINVTTLIHLWAAQGFIESPNSSLSVEDRGREYFMDLFWRSFFHEAERDIFGNVESCKMHDLMHDLATLVAGKQISKINSNDTHVDERARHVSFDIWYLRKSHQIPAGLCAAKKLRTFLLPHQELYDDDDDDDDDDDGTISLDKVILPNFKKLRVFDMDSCGIEKVPSFIKSLRHLRYLNVSRNKKIKELPNFITNLLNLQVLNVSECHRLQKLPKDIKKLISLRHLYCAGCLRLHYMPRGIGQLTSLQTLSMFMAATDDSVSKYAGGLDEMDTLNNLRGSLEIRKLGHGTINPNLKEKPLLQSLILHFDDNLYVHREEMASCLQPHSNLKELEVWAYRGFSFPSWVSSLTNAVIIRIFHCSKCQHLPPLHQLPSLQYLEINSLSNLEYIETEGQGTTFFPSLKHLQLTHCRELKGWRKSFEDYRDDPTAVSSQELLQFPCLSQFHCHDCPNLSWIPQLPSLDEELELFYVSAQLVQQIFTTSISSSSSSIVPPLSKLKNLSINTVEELESLPPDGLQNLTSLQQLQMFDCPRLTSFPQEMRSLTSLQELKIVGCPLLNERCANKKGENWHFISHIPNIEVDWRRVQWEGRYLLQNQEKSSTS